MTLRHFAIPARKSFRGVEEAHRAGAESAGVASSAVAATSRLASDVISTLDSLLLRI
jgi:hypothetical protein